jgi:hypothetical protein
MITVKRHGEDSSQKVISNFLKRVKKSNLVARKRKTQFVPAKLSPLRKKRKAIQRISFEEKKALQDKVSKV